MSYRLIFMGTPDFAVPILASLLGRSHEVVAVYTQPDKRTGRGQKLASPPVKRFAQEQGIPVVQPETLRSAEMLKSVAGFRPELIVVAAFTHILPGGILSLPRYGCLNVHPSLLPRHRGPSPVSHAILCGDRTTGVTIMLMDEEMDSGPVLAQREVDISPEDTTGALMARLANVGSELLKETLPEWIAGGIEPQPQDKARATYSKLITSEEGRLDWSLPAEEIGRRVRAYNPWPGCYTYWRGKRLKVLKAFPLGDVAEGRVGEAVSLTGQVKAGVITGKGVLGLCEIQVEGKRQLSVKDFVLGRRDFSGSFLS